MHLLLHPFTRERKKNENAKKHENAINAKKTKTHIFKNEDASTVYIYIYIYIYIHIYI